MTETMTTWNVGPAQAPLESGFGARSTAEEVVDGIDLTGKLAVVTGGSAGIGTETVRVLAGAGARVVVGARDLEKAGKALAGMAGVEAWPLDLSDPASIDRFALRFAALDRPLDLLINNAGIMAVPLSRDDRGYELQFATNHLGHFQLTAVLWGALKRSGNARVVCLTSLGHRRSGVDLDDPNYVSRPYDKLLAYGQSKSANAQFAVALDRRGRGLGIRAYSVHPGRILETDLARHMTDEELAVFGVVRENGVLKGPPDFKNVAQGAATSVWCAVSRSLDATGGVYCEDCDVSEVVPDDSTGITGVRGWAVDKDAAEALWVLSERLTGLRWPD